MRKIRILIGIVFVCVSLGILSYPDAIQVHMSRQAKRMAEEFQNTEVRSTADVSPDQVTEKEKEEKGTVESDFSSLEIIKGTPDLLVSVQDYNEELFTSGQASFADAWAVTQAPDAFGDLSDDIFGYIEIPDMNETLPLYLGASEAHMAKGAVILGETSLPVGGRNTNCVIAGHRGYQGIPFFRDIEVLSVGDPVYTTNPWETLTYTVASIEVIHPYDSEKVRIQEGKDMVTLMTCHPYRSHGKYRYVVYCSRQNENVRSETTASKDGDITIRMPDDSMYKSSQNDIRFEGFIRHISMLAILIILIISVCRNISNGK